MLVLDRCELSSISLTFRCRVASRHDDPRGPAVLYRVMEGREVVILKLLDIFL